MDDGQIVCSPSNADRILKTIDEEAVSSGVQRSVSDNAKTVCRLVCPDGVRASVPTCWYSEYIRNTS